MSTFNSTPPPALNTPAVSLCIPFVSFTVPDVLLGGMNAVVGDGQLVVEEQLAAVVAVEVEAIVHRAVDLQIALEAQSEVSRPARHAQLEADRCCPWLSA